MRRFPMRGEREANIKLAVTPGAFAPDGYPCGSLFHNEGAHSVTH